MDMYCPICRSLLSDYPNCDIGTAYSCPECGSYSLGDYINGVLAGQPGFCNIDIEDIPKLRSAIFYYLKVIINNSKYNNFIPVITLNKNDEIKQSIDINTLINLYPENISKRLDMVLQLLATKIKDIDESFIELINDINSSYFMPSKQDTLDRINQANNTVKLLEELHYIREDPGCYTFTTKGWERLDYLNRNRSQSNTAFIAMSFSENKVIIDAETTIKRAIARAHYLPMIIKEKEHNNYIMPEIIREIKNSKFVIADLTELKAGVYYEAGYAKALEKEVIFTCHERNFDERHFDIAQINTIKWSNNPEDQLKVFEDQLYNRIISTVGENI